MYVSQRRYRPAPPAGQAQRIALVALGAGAVGPDLIIPLRLADDVRHQCRHHQQPRNVPERFTDAFAHSVLTCFATCAMRAAQARRLTSVALG